LTTPQRNSGETPPAASLPGAGRSTRAPFGYGSADHTPGRAFTKSKPSSGRPNPGPAARGVPVLRSRDGTTAARPSRRRPPSRRIVEDDRVVPAPLDSRGNRRIRYYYRLILKNNNYNNVLFTTTDVLYVNPIFKTSLDVSIRLPTTSTVPGRGTDVDGWWFGTVLPRQPEPSAAVDVGGSCWRDTPEADGAVGAGTAHELPGVGRRHVGTPPADRTQRDGTVGETAP